GRRIAARRRSGREEAPMTWEPLLPSWLMILVVLVAAGAAAWTYRAPSWVAALRFAALVVLALFLANPVRVMPDMKRELSRLALVLDSSGSMAFDDASGTRLAAGRAALKAVADGLGGRYRMEQWHLADQLSAGSATQAAGGTAFDGLSRFAHADVTSPVAAVVLASDGGDRG